MSALRFPISMNFKKAIRLTVFFGLLLFKNQPLLAQGPGHVTAVWANDGGDKVTRDELRAARDPVAVRNRLWDGQKISLFGGKNEVVQFVLHLEAATATVSNVTMQFNRLTGPDGAVISSVPPADRDGIFKWTDRPIELYYVRYLQIKGLSLTTYGDYDERHVPNCLQRPWHGEGIADTGTGWINRPCHDKFYPEIAVPIELLPASGFDVLGGQSQGIWSDIYISKSAATGLYVGTVTIRENGIEVYTIPVELTVRSFTLPEVPNSKTMLFFSHANVNDRYFGRPYLMREEVTERQRSRLIRDRHFQIAHRHRVYLIDTNCEVDDFSDDGLCPEWPPRLDGTLFSAARDYDGPGTNTGNLVFAICPYGQCTWKCAPDMETHIANWIDVFEHLPPMEHFLYVRDEPREEDIEQVEACARRVDQRLLNLVTNPAPLTMTRMPSVSIATSTLDVGITADWDRAAAFYLSDPRRRFYFYNGSRPASGSFVTDDDGVALRELPWGQYKKRVQRWFYWEGTYYHDAQYSSEKVDLFQTAKTFGWANAVIDDVKGETGDHHSNGEGVLFYPGTDVLPIQPPHTNYGVNGPFASLRLKHWRRGIQDVDYLTMAAGTPNVGDAVDRLVAKMVPKALWEYGVSDPSDPTFVRADISWSINPDRWEKARACLADIIEGAGPACVDGL